MGLILVPTERADYHAIAVELALRALGVDCVRWLQPRFPDLDRITYSLLNPAADGWSVATPGFSCHENQVGVIWFRRVPPAKLPPHRLHRDDYPLAQREAGRFQQALWSSIGRNAKWVNPVPGAQLASSKATQLRVALDVGLRIPETLLSNDPDAIRRFMKESGPAGTVTKSLGPFAWSDSTTGAQTITCTASVKPSDLPTDSLLALTPAIFQRNVPKKYELRITCMGRHCVTMRSRLLRAGAAVDWRLALETSVDSELCTIPEHLHEACMNVMKCLGIVFGTFDFAVTPSDEVMFLEVNEAGNFLFVEDMHPQARLLHAFAEFIQNPVADFVPTFDRPIPPLKEVLFSADFNTLVSQDSQRCPSEATN